MTKTRSLFAGALLAGLVTVGTGGVAFAQSTQPTTPNPATARHDKDFCDKWVPRLPGLEANVDRDNRQIGALNEAIQVARAHHHEDVAERLERQRERARGDRDREVFLIASTPLRGGG